MAHWFHRNPLKSSKTAKFELKQVITNSDSSKICSELRLRREQLLDILTSASASVDLVESEFEYYLKLLYGFVFDLESQEKNSKLRYLGKFTWTHSMLGGDGYQSSDSWYEVLNMVSNIAIWYMKRSAFLSSSDEVSDFDSKNIHTALRKAAGLFEYVSQNADKVGIIPQATGNDLDARVLTAYKQQCLAEAQEITIARAIELKHSSKLIYSLANQTSKVYEECCSCLDGLDPNTFEKWRKYFELKKEFYLSYAYAYLCEHLLSNDECGKAIRACQEGQDHYKTSASLCVQYAKSSGPGFVAKPEDHLFFRRIDPILVRHMDKARRENDFIYHQSVPSECPSFEAEAEFGLASKIDFNYPPRAEIWTNLSYKAFDITKSDTPDFKPPQKIGKIPLVKEKKVYETDRDPSNLSGCTIS
ncbi:unnamed protein product [Bursaphelenchus xylophilus]|uniref:(pine wood nematode) hypothetical protein n=1 Tax=Bursaphelenchus xylophilus TaxID=6326 RepID=A0A1I7RSL2_BURXY|nr:unnamed protein product [Bursaphelenchus xylophilus]CAG9122881.1 unnamed protein product [Bursaphelenchus xylophilus]